MATAIFLDESISITACRRASSARSRLFGPESLRLVNGKGGNSARCYDISIGDHAVHNLHVDIRRDQLGLVTIISIVFTL